MLRPRPGAIVRLIAPKPTLSLEERAAPSFPLEFRKRTKGLGYHIAFAVVCGVFGTTFLCFTWIVGYAVWARQWEGWWAAAAFLGLLYAVAEVLFFFYLKYVTSIIQQPAPPSNLSPEECRAFFVKMLQAGMQEDCEGGKRDDASQSGRESIPSARDIQEKLEDVISLARTGRPDPSHQHTHEQFPQQDPRSTGRMRSSASTDVDSSSPPSPSGLRHRYRGPRSFAQMNSKLSDADVYEGDAESVATRSPMVKLRRLERDDPRAVEFREKLRNWHVPLSELRAFGSWTYVYNLSFLLDRFGRVPWDSITRTDVLRWLAWSCCNLPYETVSKSPIQMALIEASVEMLEARTGTTFTDHPSDRDGAAARVGSRLKSAQATQEDMKTTEGKAQARVRDMVKLMRLTLDPVNTRSRPLFIYALRAFAETRARRTVYRDKLGFELYREGDMDYLLRLPPNWTPERQDGKGHDPILYLHGLGFGLVSIQNMHALRAIIERLPHSPIIVPIQLHISMHVFHPRHLKPPSRSETVSAIRAICKRWGFWTQDAAAETGYVSVKLSAETLKQHDTRLGHPDVQSKHDTNQSETQDVRRKGRGIMIFSHSNGSIAHGWLIKDCPEMILKNALVDPVVFCLWEGDVCYNFCYREPHNAIELLLHWFIASEIGIANSIQRHFDWSNNTLFHDEIPEADDPHKTLVVLGGEDVIIDAWRVKGYLNRHGMSDSLAFDPAANHGEGLWGESLQRIVAFLEGDAQ